MLLLNVPYEEKDEAKALGARWLPEYKKWAVMSRNDYSKFKKWFKGDIIYCDHIYLATGTMECFRCKNNTTVVGIGVDEYMYFQDDFSCYHREAIHIGSYIEKVFPKELDNYVKNRFKLYYDYSKFMHQSYTANHCCNCGVLQGDFFVFNEVDSPFVLTTPESVSDDVVLYKYTLPYDVSGDMTFAYGSNDYLFRRYATIKELIIPKE